jgi:CRP-like cAMP-binding protein
VERAAAFWDKAWCLSEVDIFCDLSPAEMNAIAAAAPMKTYAAGELLFFPHNPVETLFILKRGRVRIFRVSADGRALTTAITTPGTIFGEMVLLGQRMYDNYAEALDEAVVCDQRGDLLVGLSDPASRRGSTSRAAG